MPKDTPLFSEHIQAQTPRMLLRVLREEDRAEFVRTHEVSAELYQAWFPARATDDTLEALFDREHEAAVRGMEQGTSLRMVGILPMGRIAGLFSLSEVVRGVFQNAYASWSVNGEVARQGYATEGVQALLDVAFAPPDRGGIGLHRVQANIIPENDRSIRLAERVGFRCEGLAQRYLKIAGVWRDHRMYAKTAEEHVFIYIGSASPG